MGRSKTASARKGKGRGKTLAPRRERRGLDAAEIALPIDD